jgi:indole-3-glycerol phosphate synthase
MNILNQILEYKRSEIEARKKVRSIRQLEQSPYFSLPKRSLAQAIISADPGIIAEIKRKSPSRGEINSTLDPRELAREYELAGAAGISVLTDYPYFGGTLEDLTQVRNSISLPILRKDFIIDEYQIFEAKAIGADAVLLIAEALEKAHLHHLAIIASSLGMEILMEIHSLDQLDKFNDEIDILGVNNRNLKTQFTDLNTSITIKPFLPKNTVLITESGISNQEELKTLLNLGYHGALIGTSIVGHESPMKMIKQYTGVTRPDTDHVLGSKTTQL